MRNIPFEGIAQAVRDLSIEANWDLGQDVYEALLAARGRETWAPARRMLDQLLENARLAREKRRPLCQDTGAAVVFAYLGQEARIAGGSLQGAIDEGVRRGYREGYLRKSMRDPITGVNTGDNTPAIVHLELVENSDQLRLVLAPKGGGSENMSCVRLLKPAQGLAGVRETVLECVRNAGGNPCPPLIVGIGLGGTMEKAALLSKLALTRDVGEPNADPRVATLEGELLKAINGLGIGPQGFGGDTTALAVHVLTHPAHIASYPVAVNLQCHAARHKQAVL